MNVVFQSLVSENILRLITPFVLFTVGIFIEKRYVSRVAMFTNAAALYIFYHSINMPSGLGILVNVAIIIGFISGITRFLNISLITSFYSISWIASSIFTAILLFVGLSL